MNKFKTAIDFILLYLKYLSKWNQSASLLSIIKDLESDDTKFYEDNIAELLNIAVFEYNDTIKNTTNEICSIHDLIKLLRIEIRDKLINSIISL